ncbi:hypothetical protein [Streptomyces sp. Amel2xC10]|uniref:hypothetical protein n=1 Tax=Streptomyces sp. Amel2xC10 TaxID=1305826 RepID=UPI000A08C7DA|nr:hypothetical protein [Streptomyces sp. Amel2xC10]SMF50951.1 hypothetical protein SAMN02745830_04080 [Streptomyces sp. Amel2xC10]
MESQIIVSLASTAVAGLAVVASLVTTLLSLRAQRENTRDTLAAQERLSAAQERALHERSHAQDLRDKRAEPYLALIKWADRLLEALDDLDEVAKPYLAVEEWNIAPGVDSLLDLYASDVVHVRYAALRGKLMGLVAADSPRRPRLVTWAESDGVVEDVQIELGAPWATWGARAEVRGEVMDDAIDLIARVRAELQGRTSRGYFIIWRLV